MSEAEKVLTDILSIWEWEGDIDRFSSHGFRCVVRRVPYLKHLCGYVGVKRSHRLYGVGYSELSFEVHGGLTFSGPGKALGLDKSLWFFGFDAAHSFDFMPGLSQKLQKLYRDIKSKFNAILTYKDMEYMRKECEKLAWQLSLNWEKYQNGRSF